MTEWMLSSSVLIVVVVLLRLLLKGRIGLRLQYGLWAVVLLRLLIPFSIGETYISVGNVMPAVEETVDRWQTAEDPIVIIPDDDVQAPVADVPPPAADTSPSADRPVTQVPSSPAVTQPQRKWDISLVMSVLWYVGMGMTGLWLLAGNILFAVRLYRSRKQAVTTFGGRRVYVSSIIETPCLFGFFRPDIYVTPEVWADDRMLRHTLEHEWTHYRHGDVYWSMLRGVALVLHWYNPLVWLAAVLSRRDGEMCCDECTVKRMGEQSRTDYGRTLIRLTCEKRTPTALLRAATTMTGSAQSIKERLVLLVKKPKTAAYTLVTVVTILALAAGCTLTGAKAAGKQDPPKELSSSGATISTTGTALPSVSTTAPSTSATLFPSGTTSSTAVTNGSSVPTDTVPGATHTTSVPAMTQPTVTVPSAAPTSQTIASAATTTVPTVFASDYARGRANQIGNTEGNLLYDGGRMAYQGDWIYFVPYSRELCKIKQDGTSYQKILTLPEGNIQRLNVVGDWIYFYVNNSAAEKRYIARVRSDGDYFEPLVYVSADQMIVAYDRLYFTNAQDSYSLYSMSTTTPAIPVQIHDGHVSNLGAYGGYIFYKEYLSGASDFYSVKADGTEKKKILSRVNNAMFEIHRGWIYFDRSTYSASRTTFHKMRVDGTDLEQVYTFDGYNTDYRMVDHMLYHVEADTADTPTFYTLIRVDTTSGGRMNFNYENDSFAHWCDGFYATSDTLVNIIYDESGAANLHLTDLYGKTSVIVML